MFLPLKDRNIWANFTKASGIPSLLLQIRCILLHMKVMDDKGVQMLTQG